MLSPSLRQCYHSCMGLRFGPTFRLLPGAGPKRAVAVREIFRRYIDAKRDFLTITARCYLKGWPDRKSAVQAWSALCALVIEQEVLRFDYLISGARLDAAVWKSLESILNRISKDWKECDERELAAQSSAYQDVLKQLAAAESIVDKPALHGPFSGAKGDPEWLNAIHAFDKRRSDLDDQLGKLLPN